MMQVLQFRRLRYGLLTIAGCLLVVLSHAWRMPEQAIAQSTSLPITYLQGAPVLDPHQFRFDSLPPFSQDGGFQVPHTVTTQLGFDPSMVWNAGDRPADVLKLGTFQAAFGLENFDLQTISRLVGLPLDTVTLYEFELLSWQSVATLADVIPSLNLLRVEQVKPVMDLLNQVTDQLHSLAPGTTVRQFIQQMPELAQTALGDLLDLKQYSLSAISGLESVQLSQFFHAGNTTISGVPGLDQVIASQFPIPLQMPTPAVVTRVDLPLQQVEGNRTNTLPISGGNQVGFNVPCQQNCAQLETREGHQWFAGDRQFVKGGEGVLASTFNGQEPTGRMPYGPAFKMVVANVNEAAATVDTQLFFRFCWRNHFMDLGCTPYGIGPVPFLTYREADPIFLGVADFGGVGETSSVPGEPPISISTSSRAAVQDATPHRRHAATIQPTFGYAQP